MSHFTPGFTSSKLSALQAIQALGLTTGLQLCLDAGDEVSYPGTGQPWIDRSGNAYNFNRGATSSAEGSDPTFNGTAGQLSLNQYWSFDGGDFFTLGQANPTWVNNLHKNNAAFVLALWVYVPTIVDAAALFGNNAANNLDIGAGIWIRSDRTFRLGVTRGVSGSPVLIATSSGVTTASTWQFLAVRVDEASASGTFQIQGNQESFTSTYSSPSTSSATNTTQIAALGTGTADIDPPPSGSLMTICTAWEGTIPTAANLLSLYNLTRGRFGV